MDKAIKTFCVSADNVKVDCDLALRFLRVRREADADTKAIFNSCLEEFEKAVQYKASYRYFDIKIEDKSISFDEDFVLESEKLAENLSGCSGAFIMVATTSMGVDRLINKYLELQLSRAVIIDAIGSAAIESFCDLLCKYLQDECDVTFRPRFSPGYSDLSLNCQGCILGACDASRKIGVTLTGNHLMIPKKTVSAIVGVRSKHEQCNKAVRCELCDKADCLYRE